MPDGSKMRPDLAVSAVGMIGRVPAERVNQACEASCKSGPFNGSRPVVVAKSKLILTSFVLIGLIKRNSTRDYVAVMRGARGERRNAKQSQNGRRIPRRASSRSPRGDQCRPQDHP